MHPNGRGGVHDGWRRPPIDQFTYTQRLLIRTCVACPIVTICDPAIGVLFGGLLRTSDPIKYLLARPAGTKGMSFARREGTGAAVARPGPVLACDSVNRVLCHVIWSLAHTNPTAIRSTSAPRNHFRTMETDATQWSPNRISTRVPCGFRSAILRRAPWRAAISRAIVKPRPQPLPEVCAER